MEAAAGTGKTTLIVDRMLRGVRDGALRLPTAVAITFTEKAAGELESRIRERLGAALDGGDLSAEEARRVRTAVEELDRATISTIHAFCARVLRERAAEAGVDPEFAVLDQTGAQVLRERCWHEWMARQVADCPEPLVEALRAGVSVEGLRRLAFALAEAPELLESGRFELPVPAEAPEALASAVRELAPQAEQVFRHHMKRDGNPHSRRLRRLAQDLCAGGLDQSAVRRLAYAVAAVPLDEALKSIGKEGRGEAQDVLGRLQGASEALGAHLSARVFQWAAGFVDHYAEAKRSRSVLDFQDLLLLSARMLREQPAVRRYFQRRFEAFFVDEFQDTDPLQAELIAYLCERPGGGAGRMQEVRLAEGRLFAVGDPKQSIYRFRRADVQIYDLFKGLFGPDVFGEARTRQVACNFRSVPRLLGWFNRLFERLFGEPVKPGVYQARHVALEAPPDARSPAGPSVVALCPEPGLKADDWNAEQARRHEAHYIARAIRRAVDGELLPGRPLSYRDFALLFRALSDVDLYETALDLHDIPYRVIGGKHFYRREQIAEALAVLQAVDDPLNEAAIVGALRSSFFGISDEELFRYHEHGGRWSYLPEEPQDGPVGAAIKMLAGWHRRRNRVPPQVLLREVFDATKAPQAFLLKPAGPQRVANLEKLLNDLRALGAAAGNFGAVVRHLSAVQEAELPEEESSVMEPGDEFVRIMSMHKAKGLEFEAVVLPDLAREFPRRSGVGPLVYNRLDGQVGLSVAPGIRSANYEGLEDREYENELAELRRLFYVACTRARRLLILPLHWGQRPKGGSFQQLLESSGCLAGPADVPFGAEQDDVLYLDTKGWARTMETGPGARRPREEEAEDVAALLRSRESWQESHRLLVRHASRGETFVLPSSMEGEFAPARLAEEQAAGAAGKDFGSLFHSLMMQVPLGREPDGETEALVRNLAAIEAAALGAPGAEEAAGLAVAALKNPEFRALIDGADRVSREVGFCVPLNKLSAFRADTPGLLEGSIDLLVLRGGRPTILDYKTDAFRRHERGAVEARYWPQLALYALAAQACGLGGEQPGLALFFVRPGLISRRALDPELTAAVAAQVAQALADQCA